MNTQFKTNTADNYILHIYRKHDLDLYDAYKELAERTNIKIGNAFGNYQISTKDIFSETGIEDLKYKNVGYGKVAFMGVAIYFKNKNLGNLYYKSKTIKNAVEDFIKVVDILCEEKTNSVKYIEKQHGKPKVQHSIIWAMAKGLFK